MDCQRLWGPQRLTTSSSSDTKSKTGRHPEWLGDLSKVKQWEKTKTRPLVFCCADELKSMNRSLVISEFRSTQKGQFLISRKHQLHVYTPRTSTTGRVASDSKHVQGLAWGGMARNCKWRFPTCEFAQVVKLMLLPSFFSLLRRAHPSVLTGNPGNSTEEPRGLGIEISAMAALHQPCESRAPRSPMSLSVLWCLQLPLSAAGFSLHLNHILVA